MMIFPLKRFEKLNNPNRLFGVIDLVLTIGSAAVRMKIFWNSGFLILLIVSTF
jgi:hypothetical protein